MSVGVTVTKNFNLANINLDLSTELNMAADIIVSDIKDGINYGRDINGTKFIKLKPSTIRSKRERGSKTPRIALSDKEIMKKVKISKRASKTKQRAEMIPSKKRTKIGQYHQEGGPNLPKREWFGISITAENKALKMMELKIEQEIRNA